MTRGDDIILYKGSGVVVLWCCGMRTVEDSVPPRVAAMPHTHLTENYPDQSD